jgi:hypothetical protein
MFLRRELFHPNFMVVVGGEFADSPPDVNGIGTDVWVKPPS